MNKHKLRQLRTRILIFLAIIGPGIITANVDNDAGGIYTYSVAGATFGYSLLWSLIPITIALIVVQEMVARMGVVTGKGLADLIREEYGFRTTFLLMVLLVVANFGNTVADFAGLASGMSVLGVSRYVIVPLGALIVWGLVVKGTYQMVEKVFLVACVFYLAYPVSAVMSRPDWTASMVNLVKPTFRFHAGFIYLLIGLVGTTITPWMQFYLQSAVVDKGLKIKDYMHSRWDVIVGCIVTDVVAFFIVVACAATLYAHGHQGIHDAADAAVALGPLAGKAATVLFAFGLCNASLFAASIIPLSTAYSVCEGLGAESGLNKRFHEAPTFYWFYTGLIVLSALIVIVLKEERQIPLILFSQVANGILLPFILIYMLRLSNRVDLMGTYRNSRLFNVIAWVTSVVMIVLTLIFMVSLLFPGRIPT